MKLRLLFLPRTRQQLKLRNRQVFIVGSLFIALIAGIVVFIFQVSGPQRSVASNSKDTFRSYQGLSFQKVVLTNDGNMIVSDGTSFIKMDTLGTVLWSKSVSSPYTMLITGLVETINGDCVAVCQSNNGANYKIGVIRINKEGGLVWFKVFSAQGSDFAYGVSADNDNGVILTGGGCNISHYIMKLDQDGNAAWMKDFAIGGSTGSSYKALVESNGDILMTGRITAGDNHYISIIKTDEFGNFKWGKKVADDQLPIVKAFTRTSDGAYAIAGTYIAKSGMQPNNPFVMKFDANGNVMWFKRIGDDTIESINDLASAPDGGLIAVGNIYINHAENVNALLMRIDDNGNTIWQKSAGNSDFSGAGYDDAYSICPSFNGKYTVVGMAYWTFISKMDLNGNGFCYQSPLSLSTQNVNCQSSNVVYTQTAGQVFQSEVITSSINNIFVAASNSCSGTPLTSINEPKQLKEEFELSLFPNPNDGNFNVNYHLPVEGNGTLQIFDLTGKKITEIELPAYTHSVSIHLPQLISGIYLYQVRGGNKVLMQDKFVVAK